MKNPFLRVIGVVLHQLLKMDKHAQASLKEGLRRHEDKSLGALISEFGKIEGNDTFDP